MQTFAIANVCMGRYNQKRLQLEDETKNMKNKEKQREYRSGGGSVQKKIILLLLGGLVMGLSSSPNTFFKVLRHLKDDFREIDNSTLNRAIRSLYKSKLIETKGNRDGTLTLVLSNEGKGRALTFNLESMKIKRPKQWDNKWRIVMFDIPEKIKKVRESLRFHFKDMGFYEFQKSVFVHPFPCSEEVEYIIEFYDVRKHVRFVLATELDNELRLKKHFSLL